MTTPVAVIIPAFNAAKTIGEQLSALARQVDAGSFEVLVCDNGSADQTAAIAAEFRVALRLRVIDASARRGAAAARNTGAAQTTAPVLLFCDADDVVSPTWVREMRAALVQSSFVAGAVEHSLLNPGRDWDFGWDQPTFTNPALPHLHAGGSGNMGVLREAFERVGGFVETLTAGEDLDFSWRMQLAGYPLMAAPRAIVHVRKRPELPAALRQAYAKGCGSRILDHRYALVRAMYERACAPTAAQTPAPAPPTRRQHLRSMRRRLRALRMLLGSPARLTPHAANLAYRVGYRLARTDGVEQVPPPTRLPPAGNVPLLG